MEKLKLNEVGKIILITFVLQLLPTLTFAQEEQLLVYRISWNGDSIGFLKALKTIESSNKTTYAIDSKTQFRILWKFKLDYQYNSVFIEDQLIEAGTGSMLNGKSRSVTSVEKKENGYQITVDGDEHYLNRNEIKTSITSLYHEEPHEIDSIFSERYGKYCRFERLPESNSYAFHKPSGRVNYYTFENRICQTVEVNNRFATIYFELIEVLGD